MHLHNDLQCAIINVALACHMNDYIAITIWIMLQYVCIRYSTILCFFPCIDMMDKAMCHVVHRTDWHIPGGTTSQCMSYCHSQSFCHPYRLYKYTMIHRHPPLHLTAMSALCQAVLAIVWTISLRALEERTINRISLLLELIPSSDLHPK